jgi:hypothetical protein
MYEAMLWHTYPNELDTLTLEKAYQTLEGDPPSKIPFIVWLLENPDSPLALPGCIDLYRHDCLHLLLKQGFTSESEAYVVGFTMGNDIRTNRMHLLIFKLAARLLYPEKYRLKNSDIEAFERGFQMGQRVRVKNLNQASFRQWEYKVLREIRTEIGLEMAA